MNLNSPLERCQGKSVVNIPASNKLVMRNCAFVQVRNTGELGETV